MAYDFTGLKKNLTAPNKAIWQIPIFLFIKKNFFQDVRNMYDFYLSQLQKTNKENPPRSNSDKNFNKKKSKIK